MPESTVTAATDAATTPAVTALPGQLMGDANPEPTITMDAFSTKAKTDGMPLNMPETTLQVRTITTHHSIQY